MALTGLTIKTAYPKHGRNLPVLIMMHAWSGLTIEDNIMDRFAQLGFFVAAPGMRGRGGAQGARDASGREIYDIYDAVNYVKANFADRISDKVICWGSSGGGGNAMACACKLPDTFSCIIANSGMSDYGYDATYGWYAQNAYYWSDLQAAIGSDPASVPNNYHSRYAIEGIINYTGGHIVLVHDEDDSTVKYNQSSRLVDAMVAASMSNYTFLHTSSADTVRYVHGFAYDGYAEKQAEATWLSLAKNTASWTIPTSGTIKVMGYVVTKRFTIWLGTGLTAAASCTYDTVAGTYTLTALTTANVSVSITQGTKTASGTLVPGTPLTLAVA